MKTLKLINFTLIVLFINCLVAQQDTLWYNAKWKITTKEEAAFFRPPVKQKGEFYLVKDYYISGTLQMEAISKYSDKDFWHGKVTWYTKEGNVYQQGNYIDNKLNGEYISFIGSKKLTAQYKNGVYESGLSNINYGSSQLYFSKTKNGYKSVMHGGNLKGLRRVEFLDKNKKRTAVEYYDDKGKLIETSDIDAKGYSKIEITYNYDPFRMRQISYYDKKNNYLGASVYYNSGTIREEFVREPNFEKRFYNPSGKLLGSIFYKRKNSTLKPFNGTEYIFHYSKDKKDVGPKVINTFKDGELVEIIEYRKNQSILSRQFYKNNSPESAINYDENGKEMSRLIYKNYAPYNGVKLLHDSRTVYEDGVIKTKVQYYPESKKQFMTLKDNKETYFGLDGKILGELELDGGNYNRPKNGHRFSYYNGIFERIEEYKDGKITKKTLFRKGVDEKIYKTIEIYDRDFYKEKELKFYSNGKKKSEIVYDKYNPVKGVFLDLEGDLLGSYDFKTKEGVNCKFFYDSDQLEELEEYKNKKRIRYIKYSKVYNRDKERYNYMKIADVDNSRDAKYFDKNGELIAKASFKDGELLEGSIFDDKEKALYHIKNGKKNGEFKKYDYGKIIEEGFYKNNLKEGLFTHYNYNGVVIKTINYLEGKEHGDAIFYNDNGEVASKLNYKNGLPFEGDKIEKMGSSYIEEKYENGKLTKVVKNNGEVKEVTNYTKDDLKQTIAYFLNSDKIQLKYTEKDGRLHGEVLSFDKTGKLLYSAKFENSKLVSGSVLLKGSSYGNGGYIILKRTDSTLEIEKGNEDGVLVKAVENVGKGDRSEYIYKLDSRVDNIYTADLK